MYTLCYIILDFKDLITTSVTHTNKMHNNKLNSDRSYYLIGTITTLPCPVRHHLRCLHLNVGCRPILPCVSGIATALCTLCCVPCAALPCVSMCPRLRCGLSLGATVATARIWSPLSLKRNGLGI